MMLRRPSDLVLVTAIAVLSGGLTLLAPAVPFVRLVCALPLVLILPGYALTAAFFPMRALDMPVRVLFSLGLSLAVAALGGLALHWMSVSLQVGTWVGMLVGMVVVASVVAWVRRRPNPSLSPSPVTTHFRLSRRDALLLGLAILVTGAAVELTQLPVSPNGVSGYTVLWMIPAGDGNPSDFRLGVNSDEFTATTYRLQVTANGHTLREWPELKLAPGDSWEASITLSSDPTSVGPVEAFLYRSDDPATIYRQVKLQLGE
jgi:uncharacterized membrane protein